MSTVYFVYYVRCWHWCCMSCRPIIICNRSLVNEESCRMHHCSACSDCKRQLFEHLLGPGAAALPLRCKSYHKLSRMASIPKYCANCWLHTACSEGVQLLAGGQLRHIKHICSGDPGWAFKNHFRQKPRLLHAVLSHYSTCTLYLESSVMRAALSTRR